MHKSRIIAAALIAFWLAFGPAVSAWAQSADEPCEGMGMSAPADDCCGDGMDEAKCLSACLASSPAMAASSKQNADSNSATAVVAHLLSRHVSILAPPDIAPPKPYVS